MHCAKTRKPAMDTVLPVGSVATDQHGVIHIRGDVGHNRHDHRLAVQLARRMICCSLCVSFVPVIIASFNCSMI